MKLVHLIDDDFEVLEGLAALFDAEGLDVRAYGDAAEFAAQVDTAGPGCVVTDLRMPQMDGIDLLHRLQPRRSDFRVIVVTGRADVPAAVEALTGGASDFVEKPVHPDLLVAKVKRALEDLDQHRQAAIERREAQVRVGTLTAREREVLELLIDGASSKEAAIALGISPRTIETYRANIMLKLAADSLAQIVRTTLLAQEHH